MGEKVKLKRTLTLRYLVAFGLAYLAPTVVFNYYGIITQSSGGMMAFAYVITTCVMFFTAFSYMQMVKAFPKAGSVYTYVQQGVNSHVGFIAGWLILLDYLLLPMICYLLFGIYMNEFFPALPTPVWVLSSLVLSGLINIVGVKTAGVINTVIIACQILFTLAFCVMCIRYVLEGGGQLFTSKAFFNPDTFSLGGMLGSSSILCVSFLGFDAVTTMAEETKDPEKTVSKAILIIAVGAGVLFAVVSYFSQAAWPNAFAEIQDPDTGIFELLPMLGGEAMSTIFLITDNLATFICAMAGLAAVSRILYGMGRDGVLPGRVFGKLSKRFRTPVNNIIITSAIALSALLYSDNLMGAASLVSFGALTGFILVNFSVFSFYYLKSGKRSGGGNIFRYVIMPFIGVAVCIGLWISINANAKILGVIWLVIGFVYLAVTTKGFKEKPALMAIEEDIEIDGEREDDEAL
ncbi:MAG: APC family permease [Clostridiales Family XIII bacterium]|jgi:amino acid transporter|nr:APC family permease [Clostridiales Family XIII bacterium]